MQMLYGKNSKHTASLLVEIIVSLFIVTLFFPQLLTLFKNCIDRSMYLYDKRIAWQRICAAEAMLKMPVFYCGYGMPSAAEEYRNAFKNADTEPFNWPGAVSADSCNGRDNAMLKIVYAKREKQYTALKASCSGTGIVQLNSKLSADDVKSFKASIPANVKNYVVFGGMSPSPLPLCVREISGKEITVHAVNDNIFSIPGEEPLYLFCAMKIFAQDGKLYTYNFRASGNQPRVDGIADIRFYVDGDKQKTLTVYILAEGSRKRNKGQIKLLDFETCTADKSLIDQWKNMNNEKMLYVSRTIWSMPNCIENSRFHPDITD